MNQAYSQWSDRQNQGSGGPRNPFRRLAHRIRSRPDTSTAQTPPAVSAPTQGTRINDTASTPSFSSTSDDDGNDNEVEASRQQALAQQDPLLPHLLSSLLDYQLTHGSIIKLVLHPEVRDLPTQHTVLARPIGASVVPTLFPKERFEEAWGLQSVLQRLFAGVVSDENFLWEVLRDCIKTGREKEGVEGWGDGIVTALWKVYEAVRDDPDGLGQVQDVEMALTRGDWMLHIDTARHETGAPQEDMTDDAAEKQRLRTWPTLKQVELNTIATAGAAHSNIVSDMHHHLLRTGIYSSLSRPQLNPSSTSQSYPSTDTQYTALPSLPPSPTLPPKSTIIHSFASTLAKAHHLYGPPKSPSAKRIAVLMVVQPENVNVADERPIEYALWDMGVPCFRVEYEEVRERTWFADASEATNSDGGVEDGKVGVTGRELLFAPFTPALYHPTHPSNDSTACPPNQQSRQIQGTEVFEISLLYLRSSLAASELLPGPGLATRLHLERSRAIKCPSVLGQLGGCKRVQQYLSSMPEAMQRFIGKEKAEMLRGRGMRMESLGDAKSKLRRVLGDSSVKDAEDVLAGYVLKPVGPEGGGHCVFGHNIPSFYRRNIAPQGSQAGYVLMERIHPPVVRGALMSQRGYVVGDVVSELGILGGVIYRRRSTSKTSAYGHKDRLDNEDMKVDQHPVERGSSDGDSHPDDHNGSGIIFNEPLGYTLKSKPQSVPEMSVIKGYGCFDTPCLVDWDTYMANARAGMRPEEGDAAAKVET